MLWTVMAVALILLTGPGARAENLTFEGCWGQAGFNLLQQDNGGVEIVFSVPSLFLEDQIVNGEMMKNVMVPGIYLPNNAGAPNLPGASRYIALPQGARAELEILAVRTEVFHNLNIAPAYKIPLDTDPVLSYTKDPAIYNRNANYPEEPVIVSERTSLRGVDAVMLGITPFQYNPITKDLVVYKDVRVRINFVGGRNHFGEDRLRSPWWDPLLEEHLLNFTSLPQINYAARQALQTTDEINVEYLIIIPDDPAFMAWADTLKRWRNEQGIKTGVTLLSEIGGNNQTLIENYVNNAYNNWQIPPVAVLLLSDYQTSGAEAYGITSPLWNNYCVSDNIYSDVNGDHLPEMAFARITAQNQTHLQTMIGKMLTYERQPSTNPLVYQRPVIAGGWQSDRWFILCCEVIFGYMQNELGKTPIRQYAGASGPPSSWSTNPNTYMIVNYFGPSPGLGYIGATPSYLTNWTGNAAGINAAINSGTFMVQHRDHGELTGWSSPSYHISDLSALTNAVPPFVFSMNCLTGKYNNGSQVFAEAFHRMNNGALGVTAASEVSYSFVNDAFTWGMYDCMWPDFDPGYGNPNLQWNLRPDFAMASGKYYLQASSWPYNPGDKTVTYNLFHHHGDAFLTMYSEVPQNLSVSHNPVLYAGNTTFTVTANAGSWIGLSVNGLLIGAAEGTGGPVNLTIPVQTPGSTMRVTVTKANYFRYMADVPVVAAQGPYVVHNRSVVNDAVVGNNNGQWDFGETTNLNTELKNLGVAPAPNVNAVLSEADPLVTILDGTAPYGTINAGDSVMVLNAFQVQAAVATPDQHLVTFTLTATSETNTWQSTFPLVINAPVVVKDTLVILDPAPGNNNGQLDPGENTTFALGMTNDGHLVANSVSVSMTCDNPQVTITGSPVNYGNITPGSTANGNYGVVAASGISSGTSVIFTLNITANGGYTNTQTFTLVVGDVRNQPSGPDSYGYRAYDNLDGGQAHPYSWMEVAPQKGGPGTALTWTSQDDATQTVNLPFTFRYYGANFSQLAICTNGWVALGTTTSTDYTNTGIPNVDGPPNMVAVYWRDMYVGTGAQVATYYNTSQHLFVVEWDSVYHYNTASSRSTYQVVLYDPAYYPTSSGDGVILTQYKLVYANNVETFGIENQAQTVGIQYGFNGAWHTNAWPVQAGRTITYTTNVAGPPPAVEVTLDPINPPIVIPAAGGTFSYNATIDNNSASPSTFSAWIMQYTPGGTWQGPMLGPVSLTLPAGVTVSRLRNQNVPASAAPGVYTYRGYVGVYSTVKWDSSSFQYTKSTTAGSGPMVDNWDNWGESFEPYLTVTATSLTPTVYSLEQNRPNPFNPMTAISFGLPQAGHVSLKVFDLQGRLVAELVNGMKDAGYHQVTFDGSRLASGLYFYQLQTATYVGVKKMMLVK
jgi:hypothetical protein